jgi:hypothetical protein
MNEKAGITSNTSERWPVRGDKKKKKKKLSTKPEYISCLITTAARR